MRAQGSHATSHAGPRGRARCRAIIDAAATQFEEKGFALTSLRDILQQAGGSRATLYEHFGDKEGLFRAMVEECCERILEGFAAGPADDGDMPANDPEETLVRFGRHIADTLVAPETAAILRILASEGHRIPDVAQAFWRLGPDRAADRVAEHLRHLATAGRLRVADPKAAAETFIGVVVGGLLTQRLILPDKPVATAKLDHYVRQSVRLFLQGIGGEPPH